jgi:hypothetical protein
VFQAKSGKELVGFLMNDFLLLTQPPKPIGNVFAFEKYANTTFKLYKKVRLKLKLLLMKSLHSELWNQLIVTLIAIMQGRILILSSKVLWNDFTV